MTFFWQTSNLLTLKVEASGRILSTHGMLHTSKGPAPPGARQPETPARSENPLPAGRAVPRRRQVLSSGRLGTRFLRGRMWLMANEPELANYKIILYAQQDGGWVAEIPALSGCY